MAAPLQTRIICAEDSLAREAQRVAQAMAMELQFEVADSPVDAGVRLASAKGLRVGLALVELPEPSELLALADAWLMQRDRLGIALVVPTEAGRLSCALARDLGLAAVLDLPPLLSLLALRMIGAKGAWAASTRGLPRSVRTRLTLPPAASSPGEGRFVLDATAQLGWARGRSRRTGHSALIGEAVHVSDALAAISEADTAEATPPLPKTTAEAAQVQEILFGPPRHLSDPASKTACRPYGLPLPIEELCTSASRAASEAARIEFPVRVSLASPDLRVWDHPDLCVEQVGNAAAVKEVYRDVVRLAELHAPDARVLGVTVAAAVQHTALLRVRAESVSPGMVRADLGFADAHGLASRDQSSTWLPATPRQMERVLQRLGGRDLVFPSSSAGRRHVATAVAEVLSRLARFVDDWREEVVAVELHPLALLIDGRVELRELCVEVSDAFARRLEEPGL